MNNIQGLHTTVIEAAEACTSHSEAIKLIHQADRLRQKQAQCRVHITGGGNDRRHALGDGINHLYMERPCC